MKKVLLALLCAALLLSLFGCGKGGNDLWEKASPETSAIFLYTFDEDGGQAGITFDQQTEHAILEQLSSVTATPVPDWTAERVTLPVYGIEIGVYNGLSILAAWSNGYLILRDGSVYEFDFDFADLAERYEWEHYRTVDSLSDMLCGRLLSEGPDGWITGHLSPADELAAPEGITMTLKERTAEKITVELTNHSGAEWLYGEYFCVQTLLDGIWYDVPMLDDLNYGFIEIAYVLPAEKAQEKTYDLSTYGDLPAGTYRLATHGLSVEFDLPYTDNTIVSITDQTVALEMDFPDVIEIFFEDENGQYYFGNPISQYITVRYADGSEEDIKTALENGRAVIGDLNRFGIHYWTQSKDEVTCVAPRGAILSIADHSLDNPDLAFDTALEPIWEDEANVYSFSCIKSHYVTVYYDDGTEENVKIALQAGRVTIDDLDRFGISYWTEPKA